MFLFRYEELITKHERKPTMGYAIFTARKLMLTNRVNQLQMRIMQLSQQQQTLSDNAGRLERAMANTRTLFSNIGNMFQMGFNMRQQQINAQIFEAMQNNDGQIDQATMQNALASMGSLLNGGANFMTTPAGMFMAMTNQTMEAINQSKMQQIKDMENQIELEMKSLETQLKAAQAELKSVEEQESKNIENAAPKFA